ncbi:cation transport regulator ChaC [Natronocella acetinitrilica]|uniref:glutathione-specific gamma-glutamylcyclotransferase n=1 Tax=Natronocella acetinitrilica TaxID=414046 RepID=A0AAE3KI16_9GAMM|nr:gamma-glutamylcyclotransferase [Natronocella acetinitrilica]MCP1676912.1 cation transport regulator ChaC [Natronocella acetinitrilica]
MLDAANTITINQRRHALQDGIPVWLFGYGSLIYKADFPWLLRRPGSISGWVRRFWQGSHDHRGTPKAPGRVVTLVEEPGAVCHGMAYQVTPEVFDHLDRREKNGYLRLSLPFQLDDDERVDGLVYIARADNPAYLGPAPDTAIAAQIAASAGPSGSNRDYLLRLAEALRALRVNDPHVERLAGLVDA